MSLPPALFERRRCLLRLGACGLLGWSASSVQAAPIYSLAELQARRLSADGIEVELLELADNGNAIPLKFSLRAPTGRTLRGFEIIAPENPNPVILRLKLLQPVSRYRFSTRIRLAMSQEVWVLALLDDASQLGKGTHTVVTSTACFDET